MKLSTTGKKNALGQTSMAVDTRKYNTLFNAQENIIPYLMHVLLFFYKIFIFSSFIFIICIKS